MTSPIFIPKEDPEIPDAFGMTIHYVTGKKEEFEVAERGPVDGGLMSFVTKDDIWHLVVIQNIVRIEYDKRYSKLVAINEKKRNENTIPDK